MSPHRATFKSLYCLYLKRLFDFLFSALMIVVLSPLLLVLGVLVRIFLGSPVLFSQERPGKDEKIFMLYKFRTMTDKRDVHGNLLPDEDRLTKFGKILRSTSLDELPELLNILKGDMSFIGPRPLLVRYLDRYNETQRRRHEVRPGMTGLAQVKGRNQLSWEQKFEYDVWYVDNVSFGLDFKVFLQTIGMVLSRKGISSTSSETMEEFTNT